MELNLSLYISPSPPGVGVFFDVYGIDNASMDLDATDYTNGSYLGTFNWNVSPGYAIQAGESLTYDVTNFVHSVTGPYFAFVLKSGYNFDFASSNYHANYGPPILRAFYAAPEPSTLALLGVGALIVLTAKRRL